MFIENTFSRRGDSGFTVLTLTVIKSVFYSLPALPENCWINIKGRTFSAIMTLNGTKRSRLNIFHALMDWK